MIYFKRILCLLGYPVMWLLSCIAFMIAIFVPGFESMLLYVKNGNTEGCEDCFLLSIKIIEWYNDIEPKED